MSDEFKKVIGGDGANVIYDGVGGDYAEPALRSIAWEGRYLVIGFPAGIPSIPLNLTLLKGCQIVGVFWGAFTAREPKHDQENRAELMRWVKEGMLKPHVVPHAVFVAELEQTSAHQRCNTAFTAEAHSARGVEASSARALPRRGGRRPSGCGD